MLSRGELERLVDEGLSQRRIAEALGCSQSTVRHWLRKHEIQTKHVEGHRRWAGHSAPVIDELCVVHGLTKFSRRTTGKYQCRKCATQRTTLARQRKKYLLVAERGGRCERCGYARCIAALQFHHRDPANKVAGIAAMMSRSIVAVREEADKCWLLCINCHGLQHLKNDADLQHSWSLTRRAVWRELVAEHGGCCQICEIVTAPSILQFHHIIPSEKIEAIANLIANSRFEAARAEAQKCVLVCGNCHAEIEAGVTEFPIMPS